ncbi:hypothetical protein [Pedobacter sp. GR22-6]|uniref:hypothetical protein n=1 Tax=Pedobacter sp. GR22-6 TaxID=3127957 RepID=UPI00307F2D79
MRKIILTVFSCILFMTILVSEVNAQWQNQVEISQKMYYHSMANPASKLFVHFDKTIYTNNETVWFTGYLLKVPPSKVEQHQVLSVALVRDIDSAVIKQDKFLIMKGLSFGSIVLPDSMLTGNYHFQVTTDRVSKGVPDLSFLQPIIIKTNIDPAFNASIKLLQPGVAGKSPNQVLISVLSREARFLPKPVEISYKYGNTFKTAKTNASGELIMSIPEQENIIDPNVYSKLKYGKDSSFINLSLPVTKRKANIGFYPEGGNLINDIPCIVSWELKDQQLAVVTSKALLYGNDRILDTIETNSYGIGKFILVPSKGIRYSVKLLHSAFADSSYLLPPVIEKGLGISITEAVVRDTLSVRLMNPDLQKVAVRIHDFKDTYLYDELKLNTVNRVLKIDLSDVPSGLQTITISDSLGRPLAERIFYAHYHPNPRINIHTDKQIYSQREKVSLKLSMNLPDTIAFVSIACVQENRLPSAITTDIESYAMLKSELNALPIAALGKGIRDKKYMEDILRVKGWRRYTWQDILNAEPQDTLTKTYDTLALRLSIDKYDKALKQPVEISLMTKNGIGFKKTDASGELRFENQDLITDAGAKIQAIVLGKHQDSYGMLLSDPYEKLNKAYTKLISEERTSIPSTIQNNTELTLKANEKVNRLREVKITAGGDHSLNYKRGANACGDYVCSFNILNCRNHISDFNNRPPVVGQTYRDGLGGGMIVYHDCKDEEKQRFIMPIPGIYKKREFYVDAHTEPLEPAYESTLYWNYGTILSAKEQELTFYTGDIIGKFRIVVQGMTENRVTQEQFTFEVKGK